MKELLLIDDDLPFTIEIMSGLKSLSNIQVVTKSTYESSIDYLKNYEPDFIIINTDLDTKKSFFDILSYYSNSNGSILFYANRFNEEVYNQIKRYNFLGYLIKPLKTITIISIIESLLNKENKNLEKDIFYFRKKGKLIPLVKKDIEYIYTDGNYCIIKHDEDEHILRYPLGKLLVDLNYKKILRSHRRYAVNIGKIDYLDITNNQCTIGDMSIPIGRLYKKQLKNIVSNNMTMH